MPGRMLLLVVLVAGLLVAAAPAVLAGGGGHGGEPCRGFAEDDAVVLRDSCLDGTAHFSPAGEDLRVVNEGQLAHNYVAVDGSFGTATLEPGEDALVTDVEPGVYRVHCTLHSSVDGHGMAGVLVVGDPVAAAGGDGPAGSQAGAAADGGGPAGRQAGAAEAAEIQAPGTAAGQPAAPAGPHPATWWLGGVAALALVLAGLALRTSGARREPASEPTA